MTPMLCFPPAGAGPSFFADWRSATGELALHPVQLPGKEKRFSEEPHRRVGTLLAQLLPELRETIAGAAQVVLFGHCFGAVLAYETAVALAREPGPEVLLVVSGAPGPATERWVRISGRDDDSFLEGVRGLAGYRHPALDDPELRELLLPGLRSDVEMHETYEPSSHPLLDAPVVAVRGVGDSLATAETTNEWAAVTRGGFRLAELPGGHMYLVDGWAGVVGLVESVLSERPRS